MKHICENPECGVETPHTLCHDCWEKMYVTDCGEVTFPDNNQPGLDGEITLYESSLGYEPFKK